jgi:hypothetical protein
MQSVSIFRLRSEREWHPSAELPFSPSAVAPGRQLLGHDELVPVAPDPTQRRLAILAKYRQRTSRGARPIKPQRGIPVAPWPLQPYHSGFCICSPPCYLAGGNKNETTRICRFFC